MVHQASLHAQVDSANLHKLDSSTGIINGRVSSGSGSTSSIDHQAIALSNFYGGSNHHNNMGINSHHQSSNNIHGTSANNNNHQNHHHLGHSTYRNRHVSSLTATAASLNSHFTHSHFNNSNLSLNSHHNLSLSSNSSAMSSSSSSSSSPSTSISPSSITLGSSPQSNLGPPGYHHSSNNTSNSINNHHHHYHSGENNATDNSHHSSLQQQQQQQQQNSSQQQNTSRYKTELCRPFEENGTCKYGEKCQFAHGASELRTLTRHPKYKTEFCRTFHTTGFCPYGPRCHFIHNSKTPNNQSSMTLGSYGTLPFGHQTSHSASPSTSPISSASSATTTNGSLSSADSTTSSSPSASNRLLEVSIASYPYGTIGPMSNGTHSGGMDASAAKDSQATQAAANASASSRRNENEDIPHSAGCATETQRLFWLHSHMNEGSRWPPAMCAAGLIGSNNARRTWQMQA